jgi:hypothetical protein
MSDRTAQSPQGRNLRRAYRDGYAAADDEYPLPSIYDDAECAEFERGKRDARTERETS